MWRAIQLTSIEGQTRLKRAKKAGGTEREGSTQTYDESRKQDLTGFRCVLSFFCLLLLCVSMHTWTCFVARPGLGRLIVIRGLSPGTRMPAKTVDCPSHHPISHFPSC